MGKNRESIFAFRTTDEWIRLIIEACNMGLKTEDAAKKIGIKKGILSNWKLLLHTYLNTNGEFKDVTFTKGDEDYIKFTKVWELETETYWKTHEDKPKDRLTAMCIARYGLQTTIELLSAWTLLKDKGMLFRFLREEYISRK